MSDSDPRRQLRTGGDRGRMDRPPGWADSLFAGRSRADREADQDAMLKVTVVLGGVVVLLLVGLHALFTTVGLQLGWWSAPAFAPLLGKVIARYARTELVVLDELGYLALPDGAAELVFQVISERNERASLIVTTNLPFGEWTKVFPDARLAKAVVDRITHRAHIIDTGNESWRFNHGLNRTKQKGAA